MFQLTQKIFCKTHNYVNRHLPIPIPKHIKFCTSIFAIYSIYYIFAVWPYAVELFSNEGIVSEVHLNWTYGYFPNFLYLWDSPLAIHFTFLLRCFSSVCIFFRIRLFENGILSWYLWASLYDRNNLTEDPSLPYVGWTYLAIAFFSKKTLLQYTFFTGWSLVIIGAFYGGVAKLLSPSWLNGQAIGFIFEQPIAYPYTKYFIPFSFILSYMAMGSQLLGPVLCLWKQSRLWGWFFIISMHLFILFTIDLTQVSLAMLIFYLFFLEKSWGEHIRYMSKILWRDTLKKK